MNFFIENTFDQIKNNGDIALLKDDLKEEIMPLIKEILKKWDVLSKKRLTI